jgi:hypothetical protein
MKPASFLRHTVLKVSIFNIIAASAPFLGGEDEHFPSFGKEIKRMGLV